MTYKFDNLVVENPTFTFSTGNVVGEYITVNVRINFGGYIDWLVGAMPIDDDVEVWGLNELKVYEI